MPTDDERREVARRLRKLHLGGGSKDLIERTLSDAIGAWRRSGMSWDFITERLADLIEPSCDRDALLALAGILRTPEQDADCGACPLRKWCDTELYNGHRITCFECKTWHTADAILEACGERAS